MKHRTHAGIPILFAIVLAGASFSIVGSLLAQSTPAGQTTSAGAAEQGQKFSASAIQIEQTDPPADLQIPEDFRVSTYENVILQVTKTEKFQHVYRSGDHRAEGVPDLVVLRMTPAAFKKGSQKEREVTTVGGATSVKIRVTVTTRDGRVLVDREVEGKVRFLGENLRATYDFSKKVAAIIRESF